MVILNDKACSVDKLKSFKTIALFTKKVGRMEAPLLLLEPNKEKPSEKLIRDFLFL